MIKIQTEHGIFTDNNVTGQTAEEVYQAWLGDRHKPYQPSFEELQLEYNVDLDYRISLIEMGLV